jgi:hypothetical protein
MEKKAPTAVEESMLHGKSPTPTAVEPFHVAWKKPVPLRALPLLEK